MNSFLLSIFKTGNVIFNLIFFYLLFTTLGMNSFKDNLEYRCRQTPDPVIENNQTLWYVDESQIYLCRNDEKDTCLPG